MIIFFSSSNIPTLSKEKDIGIYIYCSRRGKNAFIFYQKKEDGKLDRDHRGKEETLSFGDKKLD